MSKLRPAIFLLLVFTSCNTGNKITQTSLQIPASISGNFIDDYGIHYTISDSVWVQHPGIKYYLLKYDTAAKYFIAKNAAANPSEANLYTRIDVMHFTNMEPWRWGFCLTTYNAKTPEEAEAKQSADRSNPKKGCGGYPFSRMKKEE